VTADEVWIIGGIWHPPGRRTLLHQMPRRQQGAQAIPVAEFFAGFIGSSHGDVQDEGKQKRHDHPPGRKRNDL
jgi:hypothetical protein